MSSHRVTTRPHSLDFPQATTIRCFKQLLSLFRILLLLLHHPPCSLPKSSLRSHLPFLVANYYHLPTGSGLTLGRSLEIAVAPSSCCAIPISMPNPEDSAL